MNPAAPQQQNREGVLRKGTERRSVKRREHIWQHGEREWKATPDGLWARPVGREHWTFEMWFTPVVEEILRLSKALDGAGRAPLVPPVEVVVEGPVSLPPSMYAALANEPPPCRACGAETDWDDAACRACGEDL